MSPGCASCVLCSVLKQMIKITTDGDRTRNPHLRKVMRYHCATMAYRRIIISIMSIMRAYNQFET